MIHPLLTVQGMDIAFTERVCADIGFELHRGEWLGLVGESGSGKSLTCRGLIGLLPEGAQVTGQMTYGDRVFDLSNPQAPARLRGVEIAMIFQDPMSALDPLMTVEGHLKLRGRADGADLLRQVGLPDGENLLKSFPHQLSGGQCQRVALACALARHPKILIADEPTTALDVTVQAGILRKLRQLTDKQGMSVLFVTHDLGVVSEHCDRVMVMNAGRIVERGTAQDVLRAPKAGYTQNLLRAIPTPATRGRRLMSATPSEGEMSAASLRQPAEVALSLKHIRVTYQRPNGQRVNAVDGVSLSLRSGEILGLVGESGSGKSTVAKTAVGLVHADGGSVELAGRPVDWHRPQAEWRRAVQYIFQDPLGAMDPLSRILDQVRTPLDIHDIGQRRDRAVMAGKRLAEARLDPALHRKKPRMLSGGQRQRATIARALALSPKVLICDESVSALDVSVRAHILDLLMDLRAQTGVAILFISHDLSVIHHLCDRVAVMRGGRIVEEGDTAEVFATPQHDYTRALLAAIPKMPERDIGTLLQGESA
ncbi:ATP-binding cassette domain-containing protein [Neorhizobium alkalisoli]|uniref:Peptide/nickel transport system ATP-binding protein n=1 Tax=Neorhizobium alkalisoli TaxID=528178 RepID=A0A561Q0Z9_9HYPH|nr:ABC transporter ATP-binding protein [Neorhizobium alkalisoli]TWF44019.1 peptide/nickel transport system ATP-binding protein [Neorhizobium alkalisoli]